MWAEVQPQQLCHGPDANHSLMLQAIQDMLLDMPHHFLDALSDAVNTQSVIFIQTPRLYSAWALAVPEPQLTLTHLPLTTQVCLPAPQQTASIMLSITITCTYVMHNRNSLRSKT